MVEHDIAIPPMIKQLIIREIAQAGSNSGVNKFYYIINVIDYCISYIGEDIIINEVKIRLDRLKRFETTNGEKTSLGHIRDWHHVKEHLDKMRPRLIKLQLYYDKIKDKKFEISKSETKDKINQINYQKIAKKISIYQPEIMWIYTLVLKITNLQYVTIPNEAFRSVEMSSYNKGLPLNKKPTQIT